MNLRAWVAASVLAIALGACSGCKSKLVQWFSPSYSAPEIAAPAAPGKLPQLALREILAGFKQPTDLQFEPGSSSRAILLEKGGQTWWLDLKIKTRQKGPKFEVISDSEMGLLGAAFHPRFPKDRRLFFNRNIAKDGKKITRIASFTVSSGQATLSDERVLLEVDQPYPNHNAGQLSFGDDGYLYIGLGDGGWRDDPAGHGQNLSTLLGSILRIDIDKVSGSNPYSIPQDNPFISDPDARPEIFAYGLRNPWRFSFAPDNRLIVADVGQDRWEEVSFAPAGSNLGWKTMEGRHCAEPKSECNSQGLQPPFAEYGRALGQSITGGYVYQGASIAALKGAYVFADFLSGRIWALPLPGEGQKAESIQELGQFSRLISSFGRADNGELFVVDFAKGELLSLVAAP